MSMLFVLFNDGNGKLINQHNPTVNHTADFYRCRRYEFRVHVEESLENTKTESPFNIINSYLKKSSIDCYTPSIQYMQSTISKAKLSGCEKIPKSFEELDIERLKQIGEIFEIETIVYYDEGVEKIMIFMYSMWQLGLASSLVTLLIKM